MLPCNLGTAIDTPGASCGKAIETPGASVSALIGENTLGTTEAWTGERAAGAAVSTVLIARGRLFIFIGLAKSGVPLPEFIDASAANQAGRQEPDSRGVEPGNVLELEGGLEPEGGLGPESGLLAGVDSSVPQSVTGPSCDDEAITSAGR